MSLSVSITITRDELTPLVRDLVARVQPDRLARIIRGPVEKCWRDHLKNFPRLPGRFAAFPKTNFGEEASRAVRATATGGSVIARCDKQGIRQRYYGGDIFARDKKLTIPVARVAYGKRAIDFPNLKLVVIFGKGAWLAQSSTENTGTRRDGTRTRKGKGNPIARERLKFLFALMDKVSQRPNPHVIPPKEKLMDVINAAVIHDLRTKGPAT